ncbi:hypothetical protein MMP66_13930 [Acinetobacter dispersus]|uniref:hypothetical protein n=1 Tax=Acinetobacter dispersus TaxID=70348 RepID=UPI001F4AE59F|nr:hypothetical protein [Acinetobacter dispersus]MCH7395357.1 hypothetical protein [Acinetobacter dispersus]
MNKFSDNYPHLEALLNGYSHKSLQATYTYQDHIHAQAFALFLANSELSTPELSRNNVAAVINGNLEWPNSNGDQSFKGVSIPLEFFEEHGLLSFYADWCKIHVRDSIDLEKMDESVVPLVQTLEHLKDIKWGRNGYTQPQFKCSETKLKLIFWEKFHRTDITNILNKLTLQDEYFYLTPGNQNYDELIITYLWSELRTSLEPEMALKKWLLFISSNGDRACIPNKNILEDDLYSEFCNELIKYIKNDLALAHPIKVLQKQAVNEDYFYSIIAPVQTTTHLSIDINSDDRSQKIERQELPKPTIDELDHQYNLQNINTTENLQFVRDMNVTRHWREPESLYTSLIWGIIEDNITISGRILNSYQIIDDLFLIAKTHLILRGLLLVSIPRYSPTIYLIWLISNSVFCDIGFYYLVQNNFSKENFNQSSDSYSNDFSNGYKKLICNEFFKNLPNENIGDRLLKIIDFLGEKCHLNHKDYINQDEYKILECFLSQLNNEHIPQLSTSFEKFITPEKTGDNLIFKNHWYLLGFWLLENQPIENYKKFSEKFLNYYKLNFEYGFKKPYQSIHPSKFLSDLKWETLISSDNLQFILDISKGYKNWVNLLKYSNKNEYFDIARNIRQYIQVLIKINQIQESDITQKRIINIINLMGFTNDEDFLPIMDKKYHSGEYAFDIWTQFCIYLNIVDDNKLDDFFEDTLKIIPLDQLYTIIENNIIISRNRLYQEEIANRLPTNENLSLDKLEEAFVSAWRPTDKGVREKILKEVNSILSQPRFNNPKHKLAIEIKTKWSSYNYKWELLNLLEKSNSNPEEFQKHVYLIEIPSIENNQRSDINRAHQKECEQFRRYLIAASYIDSNPQQSKDIIEALYKETQSSHHLLLQLDSNISLSKKTGKSENLDHILKVCLTEQSKIHPADLSINWINKILESYTLLKNDGDIDYFWSQLSPHQQNFENILYLYCQSLINRNKPLIAQQLLNQYCQLNKLDLNELKIDDLMKELLNSSNKMAASQLIEYAFESGQRTPAQLSKHYAEIVSSEFNTYVSIISPTTQPHEFLKNIFVEICGELLLRKKNLQLHDKALNLQISEEDLINDWLTSLFDKRMAEARIGFRDQKRGGQSSNGLSPGEIDGFITDSRNRRIAIFEAFRLFSLTKDVIDEHIDKIHSYDEESLDQVFIMAYCDVVHFDRLVGKYISYIDNRSHIGFQKTISPLKQLSETTENMWVGIETRMRGDKETIFYHFLLNMKIKN